MRNSSQNRSSRPNNRTGRASFRTISQNTAGPATLPPAEATERDPLIPSAVGSASLLTAGNSGSTSEEKTYQTSYEGSGRSEATKHHHGSIRERRASKSPSSQHQHFHQHHNASNQLQSGDPPMGRGQQEPSHSGQSGDYEDHAPPIQHNNTYESTDSPYDDASHRSSAQRSGDRTFSSQTGLDRSSGREAPHPDMRQQFGDYRQQYYNERANRILGEGQVGGEPPPPLLGFGELSEEVFSVRRAALSVLDPLTYTWLVVTVGFSLSVLLGMARWTGLLPDLAYWFIILPSWLSHVGLLVCHILSARALSTFIAEANDNRQRQDSTDHLDRTEYLPLLQRSLKFGLKTGVLSFCVFVFEVLIYLRISRGSISLAVAFIPIWIIVLGGIIDGIICKTQHILRVLCWVLVFATMILTVLKVDHDMDSIRWRVVVSPVVALLSISSGTLIYIVYGHQVGYFRLTESQLTAGILYSMSTLICIVLVVIVGEVIPVSRPVEVETRVFVVTLAPLVVALVGMGAWAVTRDEFRRLLQYGGQAAVHPMKLRLEPAGWTAVESKGVTIIPMFGEVSYEPLDSAKSESIELCACCACYPYEDDDEGAVQYQEQGDLPHPYLSSASSQTSRGMIPGVPPRGIPA